MKSDGFEPLAEREPHASRANDLPAALSYCRLGAIRVRRSGRPAADEASATLH